MWLTVGARYRIAVFRLIVFVEVGVEMWGSGPENHSYEESKKEYRILRGG